jgi:hypothetical protein
MDSTNIQTIRQPPRLTSSQARRLCEKIHSQAENLRALLLQLREGKGWLALGYASWASCCEHEFGYSKRYANYLIQAERVIDQGGNNCSHLNEAQARELAQVPEDHRQNVLDWATEKADGKPLTAKMIQKAREEYDQREPDQEIVADDEDATSKAARMVGVSVEMIEKAGVIRESGDQELIAAVERGEINLDQAVERIGDDLEPLVRAWMKRTGKSASVAAVILESITAKLKQEAEK